MGVVLNTAPRRNNPSGGAIAAVSTTIGTPRSDKGDARYQRNGNRAEPGFHLELPSPTDVQRQPSKHRRDLIFRQPNQARPRRERRKLAHARSVLCNKEPGIEAKERDHRQDRDPGIGNKEHGTPDKNREIVAAQGCAQTRSGQHVPAAEQ